MDSFRIMEWNINHRLGYSKETMPNWVINVIKEISADIVILTECSQRVPNWLDIKERLFADRRYVVFESNNDQAGQNDVLIAINKYRFNVMYSKAFYSGNLNTPDHLEVKVKTDGFKPCEFSVIGMRIHPLKVSDENDSQKNKAFRLVLDSLSNERNVIIGGDFNNYRRGCTRLLRKNWCMEVIDEICTEYGFQRYTPPGASIYQDFEDDNDNAFAEDHFIIKGFENVSVYPYDRSFTKKDQLVYLYGNDFTYYNWSVSDPCPDHAILIADIAIE